MQNTGQGKPLHRLNATFLAISGSLNCHLKTPFSLMVKKDEQSLSKCFRKLYFSRHYSHLIKTGLSKLLSSSVTSSCYCRDSYLNGCLCLYNWNGAGSSGVILLHSSAYRKGCGNAGSYRKHTEASKRKRTRIRLPSLINM